jgi:hypothetical protein
MIAVDAGPTRERGARMGFGLVSGARHHARVLLAYKEASRVPEMRRPRRRIHVHACPGTGQGTRRGGDL